MSATRPRAADLPSIDRLLNSPTARQLIAEFGRGEVRYAAREQLDQYRDEIASGARPPIDIESTCRDIGLRLEHGRASRLRPVFNLSGTILHTNLGRAPFPSAAIDAMIEAARSECNLEFDLDSGRRSERDRHLEDRLCRLTGAEAATLVNNNAAAVMLILNTLAHGRGVLVSRGELIEIGASFRIPDIMASAGVRLIEVGTTNRTHLHDYRRALDTDTALILKVHPSNYVIEGFTASAPEPELARLAADSGIPLVIDLGSGSLIDLTRYGLPREPTPMEALENGAELVTFSGDKLPGGPQAGVILGRRELIRRINANPMKRALRCGKIAIAAMSALLDLYARPECLPEKLPVLRRMLREPAELRQIGSPILRRLEALFSDHASVSLIDCDSQPGSGSLPNRAIASAGIEIRPRARGRALDPALQRIARAFRRLPIPVIGRIHRGALLFDLRCLEDVDAFLAQLPELEFEP